MDQTQKYSSLLAQRLGGEEVLALPAPQSTPLPAGSQPSLEPNKPQTSVKAEEIEALDATAIQADDDLRELDDAAGSSGTVKVEPIQGSQVCMILIMLWAPLKQLCILFCLVLRSVG